MAANFIKIGISVALAAIFSIIVCFSIEQFGGAIGGIIGTIPSTILPASYVLLTEALTTEDAISGGFGFPIGASSSAFIFLPLWRILPPLIPKSWAKWEKLTVISIISLCGWAVVGFLLTFIQTKLPEWNFPQWAFAPLVSVCVIIEGACMCWVPYDTPRGKKKVSPWMHLARGVIVAIIIFTALLIASYGSSAYGGLITAFPVMFIVSMVTISITQDDEVVAGAVAPLILGTPSGHIYCYITTLLYVYANMNIWLAIVIGFIGSIVLWSIPSYAFLEWRKRVKAQKKLQQHTPTIELSKDIKDLEENKEGVTNTTDNKEGSDIVSQSNNQSLENTLSDNNNATIVTVLSSPLPDTNNAGVINRFNTIHSAGDNTPLDLHALEEVQDPVKDTPTISN